MTPIMIFKLNQKLQGNKLKKNKLIFIMGNQPPINKIEEKTLIINMFAYSPKKNNAKVIAEYSTL
jgi:hypothetical protein